MPCSTAPIRTPKYSFTWAAHIIDKAWESHPRGWEILSPVLGLSRRQLAYLIACNDPTWPQIRTLVHRIERWEARQQLCRGEGLPWSRGDWESLFRLECKSFVKSLQEYLTGRISKLTL